MLASFRTFANTWPARIFFVVLGVSFMGWGIGDVVRNLGNGGNNIAMVEGHAITPAQFSAEFDMTWRRITAQITDPSKMPPDARQTVARNTTDKLVTLQAIANEEARLHIAVPDEALRAEIFKNPDFQGIDGNFSRDKMLQILQSNNLTEQRYLDLIRRDLGQRQLLDSVATAAEPSDTLTSLVFNFMGERRTADMLLLPFAGRALPPPPAEPVLERFFANNPDRYTAPEYRHVHIMVLSPTTIGHSLPATDAELKTWWDAHKSEFVTPEKRSLEVITTGSPSVAKDLAAQWRAGATWDAIQAAAKAAGASSVTMANASRVEIPAPELAAAAFTAPLKKVIGPINEPLGSQLVMVMDDTPGKNPTLADLRATVRDRVGAEKAADLIEDRAQKLQDLFAGGSTMDEIPSNIGAVGDSGTLDAQGNTQTGEPAPLPVSPALRPQLLAEIFKATKGDAPQLTEGPNHEWYAFTVDDIIAPKPKKLDDIRAQVVADWQADQIHHIQEIEAAHLVTLVHGGQTLANAAWGSGLQVTRSAPLTRDRAAPGVPAELSHALFGLKPGQATMVETNQGFVVASLADIIRPDATSDPIALKQTRDELQKALKDDYQESYADGLRQAAKPTVNLPLVQSLVQQPGD